MKCILAEDHVIDFERYDEYLTGVEDVMDPRVFEFARNPDHFNLSSPSSLHDAWLEEFRVAESRSDDSDGNRISVTIVLLGAFHDRRIVLEYDGVSGYDFSFSGEVCRGTVQKHGDVYTHEMRIEEGVHVHEILFADGHRFMIRFKRFSHREELVSA